MFNDIELFKLIFTSVVNRPFTFEKAYSLYRLNRPEEALRLINEEPNLTQNFKELKAQILYKLER